MSAREPFTRPDGYAFSVAEQLEHRRGLIARRRDAADQAIDQLAYAARDEVAAAWRLVDMQRELLAEQELRIVDLERLTSSSADPSPSAPLNGDAAPPHVGGPHLDTLKETRMDAATTEPTIDPALDKPARLELELDLIDVSPNNPRKSKTDLGELGRSMERNGLIHPILVRPRGKRYELVCGHRRYAAAKALGWPTIRAEVRLLDDIQAVEIMLIENSARADVPPLEEAEAFRRLHTECKLTVEEIADRTGKSRGLVHQRLRLCSLSKKAKEELEEGRLTIAAAQQLARLESDAEQDELLDSIAGDEHEGPKTGAQARAIVERQMRLLKDAPFDRADAQLVAAAGACGTCPKRTCAQAELFGDPGGAVDKKVDRCTDADCWGKKLRAHGLVRIKQAKADKLQVLESKKAQEEVFGKYQQRDQEERVRIDYRAPYVEASEPVDQYGGIKKSWKSYLGDHAPPVIVAVDPDGLARELFDKKAAEAAKRKVQGAASKAGAKGAAGADVDAKAVRAKDKEERAVNEAVVERLRDEVVGHPGEAAWACAVRHVIHRSHGTTLVSVARWWAKRGASATCVDDDKDFKPNPVEATSYLLEEVGGDDLMTDAPDVTTSMDLLLALLLDDPDELAEVAAEAGIKVKEIEKAVRAERKAGAKAKPAAAPPTKKAKAKASKKKGGANVDDE